jgi:exodeoxyribonuclease III
MVDPFEFDLFSLAKDCRPLQRKAESIRHAGFAAVYLVAAARTLEKKTFASWLAIRVLSLVTSRPMRIVTYNINGISARLPNLLRWLAETTPDVVCLQELKAPQERFPEAEIRNAGYHVIWHGQKSWNGVAILSRNTVPVEVRRALPGDPEDLHSRYIEATLDDLVLGCLYLPNGNPAPGPKFDYKLKWLERLIVHGAELFGSERPVVLAGDFNVIPTPNDVYKPERWVDDALFRVETREAFGRLMSQGWTDAIRAIHPTETIYTFWDFFRNAFGRNAGIRIDHLLLNAAATKRLANAGVDREVRGWERPSDHAPTWIELRPA